MIFCLGVKLTDQVLVIHALDEDADGSLSVVAKRIGDHFSSASFGSASALARFSAIC